MLLRVDYVTVNAQEHVFLLLSMYHSVQCSEHALYYAFIIRWYPSSRISLGTHVTLFFNCQPRTTIQLIHDCAPS